MSIARARQTRMLFYFLYPLQAHAFHLKPYKTLPAKSNTQHNATVSFRLRALFFMNAM